MWVMLESCRSILYSSCVYVDRKEKLEELIERKKAKGESVTDEISKVKHLAKIANLLTPLTKYTVTEAANKITYDAIQIHGGTGYMKEFRVERFARDARITNIYEGTSQLQIVAAAGGVTGDILKEYFDEKEKFRYPGSLENLAGYMVEIRKIYYESLKYILDKKDAKFQDVAAKDLVEIYGYLYIGYLLLDEAVINERKKFIANRYIINSLANAKKNAENIKNELFSDILHVDKILQ